MLFKVSVKSLTLLSVVGVASVTGANLRHRRTTLFGSHGGGGNNNRHDDHDDAPAAPAASSTVQKQPPQQQPQLRSSSSVSVASLSSASGDNNANAKANAIAKAQLAAAAAAEPSLSMDRGIYLEGESITVSFAVGSPSHPYYSSEDAPSLLGSLDLDYPKYSIGLFMRDADPQGGTLPPIVSINACAAFGEDCDVDDRSYVSYGNVVATFGSEYLDLMSGQWPLEVSSYGTGYDAYVLDGKGAAAIGPLEFYIRNEYDMEEEDVDTTHSYNSSSKGPAKYRTNGGGLSLVEEDETLPSIPSHVANSPLMKYQKGTKLATERTHTIVSKATSKEVNTKIISGNNNVEMMPVVATGGMANSEMGGEEEEATTPMGTIASDKGEYEYDDSVMIDFSLIASEEEPVEDMMSKYRIGIFMRMAHPQGGELEPVVSLPLCPNEEGGDGVGCTVDGLMTMGSVTFSSKTLDMMWPIDLYQWGTGFDAYILDETGDDVVGPVKFNIMMNDTY